MESRLYLDTHILVWLYAGMRERLSARARRYLESHELLLSPMAHMELDYLREIGRIRLGASEVVSDLQNRLGISYGETEFLAVARMAARVSWTRDPFDRMIAAQAMADNVSLLTADEKMRANFELAIF